MKILDSYVEKRARELGYIKASEVRDLSTITEEELNYLAVQFVGEAEPLNKKLEADIFKKVAGVDGFSDYLRETMARDKDHYFRATSIPDQLRVRGAFARTLYLKALCGSKKPITGKFKLESKRYA